MHKNVYESIRQYEEVRGDMIERLNAMGLNETFQPIIDEYGSDPEKFNQVLFYIIHCYSRESDFHIQHVDWGEIKSLVAKRVGIDTEGDLFFDLFDLRNTNFTVCIRQYMDYQGSRAFKHLMMLKDLYNQMINSAIENITDKDDKIWYEQKVKNAQHAESLYEKIAQWEQRIEGDEVKLNKPRTQLNEVEKKKDRFTLRMEDNLAHDHQ